MPIIRKDFDNWTDEEWNEFSDRAESMYVRDIMELLKKAEGIRDHLNDTLLNPHLPTETYVAISAFIEELNLSKIQT